MIRAERESVVSVEGHPLKGEGRTLLTITDDYLRRFDEGYRGPIDQQPPPVQEQGAQQERVEPRQYDRAHRVAARRNHAANAEILIDRGARFHLMQVSMAEELIHEVTFDASQ